jgi:SOS response regulatory protein OraA/RecX
MKYIVKHRFHSKSDNKNYLAGEEYETHDIERVKYLANLGLLEYEIDEIEYETKVIKTRGRKRVNRELD